MEVLMERTILRPQQLRAWLDTHQAEIKQAVLTHCSSSDEPTDYRSAGLNFIAGYLNKAGISFDQDDDDCQRVIAIAGSWVTRWRLGYK